MRNNYNIALAIIILSCAGYGHAVDGFLITSESQRNLDRLERQKQQDDIKDEKLREQRFQQDEAARKELINTEAQASKYHFSIKEIVIDNDNKYEFSAERNAILNAYLNTEMGDQEIVSLVKELTNFYIGRGYVTTQVTIVPGSLRSEKLELKVLWGKISGFLHNGLEPDWREKFRMFSAMPFSAGKLLNMSDVDQGLDNLLRVSSTDRLLIEPDEESGYSRINHSGEGVFPLSVHLGVNNSGYRDAGWYQYYVNTSLKNVLGINDSLNYYYSYNDLDFSDDNQYSKSLSFSFPLGYWSFDANYYKSTYKKTIGGNYGGYVSNGQSERFSLKTSRTLYRNASGKYSGYAKLEKRNNENYIVNQPIAISSKDYSSLNTGVNWVGSIASGWAYIDLSMTFGLPWMNAAWKNDSDLSGFDLDYKKYNGILSWSKSLISSDSGLISLDYDFTSGFQFTNDKLVSDAKYNVGDEYSVRGYKENTVSAERALWVSNTIKMPLRINYARIYQISPFTGFDLGMARRNCPAGVSPCERDYMSGAAAGIKASGKDFSTSFSAGWPVKKPASLRDSEVDNVTLYFNFDVGF